MGKKISSVMVEKSKLMKENFKKKGLPELLSEVNFSIDTTKDRPGEIIKKFISAVKRKFKNDFFALDIKERMAYFEKLKINDVYSVELLPFNRADDEGFYDYMESLLFQCQPKSARNKGKENHLVKVKLQTGDTTEEGFSLLDGELGRSYHRTSRAFVRNKGYGYNLLFDISSLIAETVVVQSLYDFAEKNKELVQYLFVRENTALRLRRDFRLTKNEISERKMKQEQKKLNKMKLNLTAYFEEKSFLHSYLELRDTLYTLRPKVPTSKEFKDDYIEIAKKFRFDVIGAVDSEEVERKQGVFYVKQHPVGYRLHNIYQDDLLRMVVNEFIRQSNYAQYKADEEMKERSDYAKAFQTKKAIKKSHQEKMKANAFLKRYGYVELDNDVDLKKFKIIEENFNELINEIHIPYRKDFNFRIKKLGKHRAAGVFFPFYRETIFDLNHPDAYVHELGHQIDFMLAENLVDDYYSETFEFRAIFDQYKQLVERHVGQLHDDHPFKAQWSGKTKYNKMYYLKPTEVFARTYEMYMTQKGIENSLLKSENELRSEDVYPFEDAFMQKVVRFYDELLEKLAKRYPIKKAAAKKELSVASPPVNHVEELTEIVGFEQLSLFE